MSYDEQSRKIEFVKAALEKYEGRLIRYVAGLINDVEKAKEIVQETFIALWKEKPEKLENHLVPWLFRVSRNRAFDLCRKERRMKGISEEKLASHSASSEDIVEKTQSLDFIMKILNQLPQKQKDVLLLKFQNDMSYAEISEVTGLSVSNVGYLIHTGITGIRKVTESGIRKGGKHEIR